MTERVIRRPEINAVSGYSDPQLLRLERAGKFPRRFKLSENSGKTGAVGWKHSEVAEWLETRAASRGQAA